MKIFKNWYKFFFKICLGILIIYVIRDKIDISQIKPILYNPILFMIAPIVWLSNQFLVSLRLALMLRIFNSDNSLLYIIKANMASLFVGNILPGVFGADIIKFLYIKKSNPDISKIQLGIILTLDRILGLVAIIFWSFIFSLFIPLEKELDSIGIFFKSLPTILLTLSILGFFSLVLITRIINKFVDNIFIKQFTEVIKIIIDKKNIVSLILILTFSLLAILILLCGLSYLGGTMHFDSDKNYHYIKQLFLIPVSLIVSMLPITPLGIGVSQVSMASVYNAYGLEQNIGVLVSTISQIGLIIVSIFVGGPFFYIIKPIVKKK